MSQTETLRSNRKTNLIEFQRGLLERFSASAAGPALNAHLGFELGDKPWLVPMSSVSEVLPVPYLEPVPLAKHWLSGVANVRGNLFAVVDLQAFLHEQPTRIDNNSRVLLVNRNRMSGAAWLVSRTIGLRRQEQLRSVALDRAAPFAMRAYVESDDRSWLEMDVERLLSDKRFLQITHSAER